MISKASRNAPCPCGSGKKYKKCCYQASPRQSLYGYDVDAFELNEEIAYKGVIGKQRAEFCKNYINNKSKIYSNLRSEQEAAALRNNETITCQTGCSHCCYLYVQANPQECEAIVYFLYHNKPALNLFLKKYLGWREEIRKNGDIFENCDILAQELMNAEKEETFKAFHQEITRYHEQNIPCPFLNDNRCLIYEVRPFTCANMAVSTPPDWCSHLNPNKPKAYPGHFTEMLDTSFYYKSLPGIFAQCMPVMVHSILKNGYSVLDNIPGLEDLSRQVISDPEVRKILERYTGASG